MGIKRYTANADNTITNAFKENLSTRGTGSNMGASDVLETFSIYAQATTSSAELSRMLVKFPVSDITTDRTNSNIPASGSVSFYLKLYNTVHAQTVPEDYELVVSAISADWQEGTGLDMENYSDLTNDGIGSNWIRANATDAEATGKVTVLNEGFIETGDTITLIATDGTTVVATATATTTTSTAATTAVQFAHNGANPSAQATLIATAINYSSYFSAAAVGADVNITQSVAGHGGNSTITCVDGGGAGPWFSKTDFTGGSGKWATIGGDYYTDTSSSFTGSFDTGLENLEVNITTLVEQWLNTGGNVLGSKSNYGVLIRLNDSYETYFSSSTGANTSTEIHNTNGAKKSYYTKKFFGRDSEFFFKRPTIEARWESVTRDDRNNVFFSSSALPPSECLHDLYLHNYVRGQLRALPSVPTVKFYYSSGSVPEGTARYVRGSNNAETQTITSALVSTGVYKATFSATSSVVDSTYPNLVDVWLVGSEEVHTGSAFTPKRYDLTTEPVNKSYVLSMPNLREKYYKDQTVRLRLFVRNRDWAPSIYSKATSKIIGTTIATSSYRLSRVSDNYEVISYGTGSDNCTILSYDSSGSYFDLDMKMLEVGYQYALKYSFYDDYSKTYVEQPYEFKFKVVE